MLAESFLAPHLPQAAGQSAAPLPLMNRAPEDGWVTPAWGLTLGHSWERSGGQSPGLKQGSIAERCRLLAQQSWEGYFKFSHAPA